MFLGYRLKELRKSKCISQSELGKLIGVSKVSVSGYEKGTRVPSMDVLLKIIKLWYCRSQVPPQALKSDSEVLQGAALPEWPVTYSYPEPYRRPSE